MSQTQYALLFGVRRSIRYHDRRRAFFERLHRLTGALTVLMAGSVLYDLGRAGETAAWLQALAAIAAVLAALDMVVGYAARAGQHGALKARFVDLEQALLSGDAADATWAAHQTARLAIERDEPPVYRALDLLCHNELALAENCGAEHMARVGFWPRLTSHWLHWADLAGR
jgi:hypothetical protein